MSVQPPSLDDDFEQLLGECEVWTAPGELACLKLSKIATYLVTKRSMERFLAAFNQLCDGLEKVVGGLHFGALISELHGFAELQEIFGLWAQEKDAFPQENCSAKARILQNSIHSRKIDVRDENLGQRTRMVPLLNFTGEGACPRFCAKQIDSDVTIRCCSALVVERHSTGSEYACPPAFARST